MKKYILPIFCVFGSFLIGSFYSIHNTDSHHWGFIMGTALDYIHGKNLFSEIYIQYGAGQPFFFSWINFLFPINYTSIGFITSIFYSVSLLILFIGIKEVSNQLFANIIFTFAFLIHPYAIYPWPDYFAGLFLSLSCLLILKEDNPHENIRGFLTGLFLFVAFLFRSTYLISLGLACISFVILSLFDSRLRLKIIYISILTFSAFVLTYLFYLILEGDLRLWYVQTIGSGSSQYGLGMKSLVTLLKNVFFPPDVIMASFSIFFYIGLFVLITFIVKKVDISGVIIFLSLVGMAGIIQATKNYEMFRLQNSCSPLYFVTAALLYKTYPDYDYFLGKKKIMIPTLACFIFFLLRFPNATSSFPIYDGELAAYQESKLPIFKWHRFRSEEANYYERMSQLICNGKGKIFNNTRDSVIPYLCKDQANVFGLPFFDLFMVSTVNPNELEDIKNGVFSPGETIVSESPFPTNLNLVEIGKVRRPKSIRYLSEAIVMVYRVGS